MKTKTPKILVLVEGEKTEEKIFKRLLDVYEISDRHEIIAYKTDIYSLYGEMFVDNDADAIDLVQLLKSREKDENKKKMLDSEFSDVILIFDLDPPSEKDTRKIADRYTDMLRQMAAHFVESTDMGKLYINYPSVEAFYHMKDFPDREFADRVIALSDIHAKKYKTIVNSESKYRDYNKYAASDSDVDYVVTANIEKAKMITGREDMPDTSAILNAQLDYIERKKEVSVLCTGVFYIYDYNPNLPGSRGGHKYDCR